MLPLIRYCRLDESSTYTLHAYHDFGWVETPQRKFPVAEAKITLVMPDEAQAWQVIQKMDAVPSSNQTGWGVKSDPYPDLTALHYAIYLPLLRERAWEQTPEALETALQGIGSIPMPEATQALLDLANDPDPKRAVQAALTLNARLPDPESQGKLVTRT